MNFQRHVVLLITLAERLLLLLTLSRNEWSALCFDFTRDCKLLLRRLVNGVQISEVCFDALCPSVQGRLTTHVVESNVKH